MSNVEQFGKFILLEKLAVGGMAEVYLAKSNGANGVSKFVAVKRILPQFSNNEDFIEMFKEEAKVAINLNHSNIVSIYDFGIQKGQFFIVMEFVEGRNLRQIVNELKKANKSISIDQAVFIVKEAAAGLDHAHRCTDSKSGRPLNITHRDMSPQNVMISFEGEAKVIDFGIAKAEKDSESTKAGTLKGKFAYMSPEQSEGLAIDPRTDVFALGIILWELLANDRLFTGSNEAAILRKVRECHIPSIRKINPLVPTELERIVMKALAKDKNVRYQTAANLQKDLNRFLNTQFPDFSPHDFSHFIKETFKEAYIEGREKLLAYAKIEKVADLEELTSTKTTAPITETAKNPFTLNNKDDLPPVPQMPPLEDPASPQGYTSHDEKVKISLDGIRGAALNRQKAQQMAAQGKLSGEAGPGHTQISRVTKLTKASTTKSHSKSNNLDLTLKILFIALFSVVSFWGYKNFIQPNAKEVRVTKKAAPKKVDPDPLVEKIEMGSTAKINISVKSEPSGAKIFVDNQDTGQTTPAIIPVTAHKDLNISLVKLGYLKYETTKSFSQVSTLEATLQLPEDGGYINVHVINGGARPVLFVNGRRIQEELPLKKYRVPANTDILIRAENAITQLSDETTIRVGKDKIIDIDLILGREQGK